MSIGSHCRNPYSMHNRVPCNELSELASTLLTASAELNRFLTKSGHHQSSLSQPTPSIELTSANAPYSNARSTVIEAAEQIIRLVRGPRETLITLSFEHCATASLQVAIKYKFASHVPLDGTTTYAAIAEFVGQSGVTPALVERIIQHTSSFGLFDARPGGLVAHNAMSALLVTDPDLEAWMYLSATIAYPAGASIPKAIEQYGYSMESDEAAYGVSLGRKVSQFQRFREADGYKLHAMFARAMRGIAGDGAYDWRHTVEGGYPWHLLEQGGGHLVVDVGGGSGHVAIGLAQKYPKLRFEVQDLPETVAEGAKSCPEHFKSRISYSPHNFFEPQPKHAVSENEGIAYFCRFIMHDWSDKYAQQILQQLASRLRLQDRILINDVVVPEPGQELRERERRMHDRDLLMLMNLNGRERTLAAFEELCNAVTPRLKVRQVHRPEQGELSLIEVTLDVIQRDPVTGNGVTAMQ